MLRFLFLLAAGFGLAVIMAVSNALRRPLARLLRALVVGLAALLGVVAVAIGSAGVQNDAWWAVVISAGMLFVALRLVWGVRRPRNQRVPMPVQHVPQTVPAPDRRWRRFESALDWAPRQRARRSLARIDAFLAERESPSVTHEHRALLISCDNRVPELIDACLERCRNASRQERTQYVDETLARLDHLGAEAERARREIRAGDDQRLQVLHRYFDTVAGDGDERRNAR